MHPVARPPSRRPLPEARRREGGRERLRPTVTVLNRAFAERPDPGEPAGRIDGQQGNADPGRAVVEGPAENSRTVDFGRHEDERRAREGRRLGGPGRDRAAGQPDGHFHPAGLDRGSQQTQPVAEAWSARACGPPALPPIIPRMKPGDEDRRSPVADVALAGNDVDEDDPASRCGSQIGRCVTNGIEARVRAVIGHGNHGASGREVRRDLGHREACCG
jgi:hypothetical protein